MTDAIASSIALIGNMNNGNFALMRYLRDLGRNAHLYLYTNELEHFTPQNDTWEWEKWRPFVHELPISNGGRDALFHSLRKVNAALSGYDIYYGNGISPVLFARMGRRLDVFAPYGEGVEFIIEHQWRSDRPLSSTYSLIRKLAMERALRSSVDNILTANMHPHSMNTYRRLGVETTNTPLIALYIGESADTASLRPEAALAVERMVKSDFVVFSHVSHVWKNLPVTHYGAGVGKRNQWLIQGFAQFLDRCPRANALLCMTEYGVDVPETKRLIAELNIEGHCQWLPAMSRKEILPLLQYVDLGGSEFTGMLWGGCGWEFLASGVPMLHNLDNPKAYETPERPLPFFFNVSSPEDITEVLLRHDRQSLRPLGRQVKEWYGAHQGLALAQKYTSLFDRIIREKHQYPLNGHLEQQGE